MAFIDVSKQKLWELLHPKEARAIDKANARDAARERERSDYAKRTAALAHPHKKSDNS